MLLPYRILLAEDHPEMREAITLLLANHCQEVRAVGYGDAALSAIAEDLPDAVVLDVSMPGLNGFQVLKELRSRFPRLAIVLLSSRDAASYRRAALARGADGFVSKNNAAKDLWASVEASVTQRKQVKTAGLAAMKIR